MTNFAFDEWKELAVSDPEAFEKRRQQEIDKLINNSSKDRQHRLRGLQWRIDMERNKYRDPSVACQKVFNLMWDSVYGDDGLLSALRFQVPLQETESAQLLTFRQPCEVEQVEQA